MGRSSILDSERATPQGTLRAIKSRLEMPVLVGLRAPPHGDGWVSQHLARMSATEQLNLLNEAVAAIRKPPKEITTTDIRLALATLLIDRCFGGVLQQRDDA